MDRSARSLALNDQRLIVYGTCPGFPLRRARVVRTPGTDFVFSVSRRASVRAGRKLTLPRGPSLRDSLDAGILGRANARNRNGRVYPKPLLQREAAAFYERHVRNRRALGELDHPAPTSPTFRCLNDANVSHQVLDYFWKGNDLMGYVEVLPTQAGGMLRDLYIAGFQLGMSSRGWATLKEEDGYIVIQEDFELITFDFVSDPSTEGAYLRPVQRRYESLRPPIDIHETYDEFMRHTVAGQAHLKKLASGEARRTTPAPAPARSAVGDDKNEKNDGSVALASRAASISGPSGASAASFAHPPPAMLVACEGSRTLRDAARSGSGAGVGSAARPASMAGAREKNTAPGTPPRAEPARARVEQSRTPSRKVLSSSQRGLNDTERRDGTTWFGSPRRNKVAPRPATPVLSLRESWNRLALRDGLRDAAA